MSHPMLPKSAVGVPKTNAERAPQSAAQPATLYGLMQGEEKEDAPGQELGRDARVWKTYVREADARDKEMVDGRNSSLDVLLIFAALFSAISTAFIIESLGDLKSDPAESAVQVQRAILETQQAMLQALAAVANGQTFSLPETQPELDSSPPTRSAVAVNVLWLLSLTLSVGVSLVAMLAKDWCYKFMSGRSGPLCEQGRRRQQKWDGIERWRMEEALTCLPGVMHLALLLFAIGLCIYLWDKNLAVATPVTAVTGVMMCIYVVATLLPMVHRYSPYSTPVTLVLQWLVAYPVSRTVKPPPINSSESDVVQLPSVWDRFGTWILKHCAASSSRADVDGQGVPMDATTARMLSWLITTSDDSRSVDVALQAIAGASSSIPCAPLLTCRAYELLNSRLLAYSARVYKFGGLDSDSLSAALRYFRSYAALHTDDLESYLDTPEAQAARHRNLIEHRYDDVRSSYARLFKCPPDTVEDGARAKLLAITSCTKWMAISKRLNIPTSLWILGLPDDYPVGPTIRALQEYSLGSVSMDSTTVNHALHSVSYYLAHCDLNECHKLGALYGSLVQMSVVSDKADTYLSRMCSVVLAVAAFMLCSYPGGEQFSWSDQTARSERALQVIDYYRDNEPRGVDSAALFAFGFVAVLPYLQPEAFDDHETRSKVLPFWLKGIAYLNEGVTIYSLPDRCFFDGHVGVPVAPQRRRQAASDNPAEVNSWIKVLQNDFRLDLSDPQLYIPALMALLSTGSGQLQELFEAILDSQSALPDVRRMLKIPLCLDQTPRRQANADMSMSSATTFYFRLYVAYIMLSPAIALADRQSTLEKVSFRCPGSMGLWPFEQTSSMPSSDAIFIHVAEDIDQQTGPECRRETLKLIADFCRAGDSAQDPQPAYPDWPERLHAIRCSRRPNVQRNTPGGTSTGDTPIYTASDALASQSDIRSAGPLAERIQGQYDAGAGGMLLTGDGTAQE